MKKYKSLIPRFNSAYVEECAVSILLKNHQNIRKSIKNSVSSQLHKYAFIFFPSFAFTLFSLPSQLLQKKKQDKKSDILRLNHLSRNVLGKFVS